MESYDMVMLAILVGATLYGAVKGLAWQLASLASLVASYLCAYQFRDAVAPMIAASPPWNTFTAMLVLYAGSSLVIWVGFRVVADFLDRLRLKHFDRQMGAVVGLGKGALLCVVVTFFAVTLLGESLRSDIVRSRSGRAIAQLLDDSDAIIPDELHAVLEPYLDRFEERLDPHADPAGTPELSEGVEELVEQGGLPGPMRELWSDSTGASRRGGSASGDGERPAGDGFDRAAREIGAEFGSQAYEQSREALRRRWEETRQAAPRR